MEVMRLPRTDYLGANIPKELQDEVGLLYRRGYTATEIVKEGIRCCSDKEGMMIRRRESAIARREKVEA
jgi:hypothetical protein